MAISFSPFAKQELKDAIAFYALEYQGLGARFKEEIIKATRRIEHYPAAWSIERGDVRKYVLHKFPYKILYSIESDHIFIIAIAHQHRRPDYWLADDQTHEENDDR